MLDVMFVAAGCDYCDSIRGIGVVTAQDVVKNAFLTFSVDGIVSKVSWGGDGEIIADE
jgi:hypothetical protein